LSSVFTCVKIELRKGKGLMNKIKYLRSMKGLSLREMAKATGIGISTIQRLEQGGKAYSTTLAKLSKFFGINLSELEEFEAVNPKSKHA
jgi:transcriptional regulator with XRE-family HTH domain